MKPWKLLTLSGAVLVAAIPVCSAAEAKAAVSFREVTFDAACAVAKTESKLVLIDFYTTWCEPCKRLDAETWANAGVGKLVDQKAVALKLDAEKEKDLAARYKIDAYPTILVLKPDGSELDRLIGFREPDKFIEEFSAGLAGRPALARSADAVTALPATGHAAVQARYDYARQLAQNGRYPEALEHYLWCFDHGMVEEKSFTGVRVSFLVSAIVQLGRKYPPALDALLARRDAAEQTMLASPTAVGAATDFAALNDALKDEARTLAAYERLPADDERRRGLLSRVWGMLIKSKRYADAAKARPVEEMRADFARDLATLPKMAAAAAAQGGRNPYQHYVVSSTTENIEVLAGSGQLEAARELGEQLLQRVDGSDETRNLLHVTVARAGHPELFPAVKLAVDPDLLGK